MYTSFYKLKEMPFTNSTDPRFLWLGDKHREALAHLNYGLVEADGYVVLTGDVGVGKTTLINALLESVDESILTVNLSHPTLSIMEFFHFLAKSWDGPKDLVNKADFLFFFEESLQKTHANGQRVLLIVDEAHRLSEELLEEIRLLSNIEHQGIRLITIFFVGQNELKDILLNPQFRALRQRITLFYDIKPLSSKETAEYIKHRLQVAGGNVNLFSGESVGLIHKFSKGYPRLINTLCGRAMLTGYIKEKKHIDAAIIAECAKELDFLDPSIPNKPHVAAGATQMQAPVQEPETATVSSAPRQHVSPDVSMQERSGAESPAKVLRKKEAVNEKQENLKQSIEKVLQHCKQWLLLPANRGRIILSLILAGILSFYLLPERNGSFAKLEKDKIKTADITEPRKASSLQVKPVEEMAPSAKESAEKPRSSEETNSQGKEGEAAQVATLSQRPESGITGENTAKVEVIKEERKKRVEIDQPQDEIVQQAPAPSVTVVPTTMELASAALNNQKYQTVIDLLDAGNNKSAELSSEYSILYAKALVGKAEQSISDSPEKAKELLLQAVEMDHVNSRAHFLLGKLYSNNKEYAQAIDAYQTASSLDPSFADSFFNLGFLYATTGMYEKSEQFFLRAVELQPEYLEKALFNLAVVQDRIGKLDESITNLRRANELNPENQKVKIYLQRVVAKREE